MSFSLILFPFPSNTMAIISTLIAVPSIATCSFCMSMLSMIRSPCLIFALIYQNCSDILLRAQL